MKKSIVLLLLISFSTFAQESNEFSFYFDKNSSKTDQSELAILNEITEQPNVHQLRFHVAGFTDSSGPIDFNEKLAKQRTKSVVSHLLLSGVSPQNILFEHEIGLDNGNPADNRRVDVKVFDVGEIEERGFAGMYEESIFDRPIPTLERQQQTYTVSSEEKSRITTSTGTVIEIPENAFMDAYGRPIAGEVEINFEEFNDPFSIFLSGITMKVNEDGMEENLESAGMFSLTATKDGRPIELRPGKSIEMEYASTSSDDDFNFYFLDQNDGEWENLGEAALAEEETDEVEEELEYSKAVFEYLARVNSLSGYITEADQTTLEEHFWDLNYIHDRPVSSAFSWWLPTHKLSKRELKKAWRRKAVIRTKLLPNLGASDRDKVYFKVERMAFSYRNKEWQRFAGAVWEYDGDMNRKELREALGGKRFQNLRLLYNEGSESAMFAFKNLDTIMQIPVKKVTTRSSSIYYKDRLGKGYSDSFKERELTRLNRSFDTKYKVYKRSLARQQRKYQRGTRWKKSWWSDDKYNESLEKAYTYSFDFMTEEEKEMDFEAWKTYCADREYEMQQVYAKRHEGNSAIRDLVLKRMGIYNCDKLLKRKDLQQVEPEFVLSDGSTVNHVSTYVFEKRVNSVIAYGNGQISFNPKKLKMIFLVDGGGKTYRLNEAEVIAMRKNDSPQDIMHVTEFDHSKESIQQVRGMVGLALN